VWPEVLKDFVANFMRFPAAIWKIVVVPRFTSISKEATVTWQRLFRRYLYLKTKTLKPASQSISVRF